PRTSAFLQQTASDFSKLQAATAPAGAARARLLPTTPPVAPTPPLCGSHMMSILTSALQCIQNASAVGVTNSPQVQQCMAAAQNAASVGTSCTDSISTTGTWDVTAGGTDCYSMAGGFDPGFGGSSGWGGGDWGGGDWGGGGWGGDW